MPRLFVCKVNQFTHLEYQQVFVDIFELLIELLIGILKLLIGIWWLVFRNRKLYSSGSKQIIIWFDICEMLVFKAICLFPNILFLWFVGYLDCLANIVYYI